MSRTTAASLVVLGLFVVTTIDVINADPKDSACLLFESVNSGAAAAPIGWLLRCLTTTDGAAVPPSIGVTFCKSRKSAAISVLLGFVRGGGAVADVLFSFF